MGLLSRFGRGLKEAAPIVGQMAQASLLQEAADKKYNRLVEREELKHTRGLAAAELSYTRGVAGATLSAQIDYYKTRSEHQFKLAEDARGEITAMMTKDPLQTGMGGFTAEQRNARVAILEQQEKTAMELYSEYDRQYRKLSDLPPMAKIDEDALVGKVDLDIAVDIAANEIIQSTEEEGATGMLSVPTIDAQIASINEDLVSKHMPKLTEAQTTAFRSAVEDRIKVLGEPMRESYVTEEGETKFRPIEEPAKTDWREGITGDPGREEEITLRWGMKREANNQSRKDAKQAGKKALTGDELYKLIQQQLTDEEIQSLIDDGYHIPEWYQTVLLDPSTNPDAPHFGFGLIDSLDILGFKTAADKIRFQESLIESGQAVERGGELYYPGGQDKDYERLLRGDETREKIRKYNPELTMQMMDLFSNSTRTV